MKKIILISLLLVGLFLIGCAEEEISDAELDSVLDELSDEELEMLEYEEGEGPLAGQASKNPRYQKIRSYKNKNPRKFRTAIAKKRSQVECNSDSQCDDNNPCTLNRCIANKCRYSPELELLCCDDNKDNDGDGKIDCADSQCSGKDYCVIVDSDNDGIADNVDNCPNVANPDQLNSDASDTDVLGDACDNCPFWDDEGFQEDEDGDGFGDECDNVAAGYPCQGDDQCNTGACLDGICNELCEFEDDNLRDIICSKLGKVGCNIYSEEAKEITMLNANKESPSFFKDASGKTLFVSDLSGIECLKNLESLGLYMSNLDSISPVSELNKLKYFSPMGTVDYDDVSALTDLIELEELYLTSVSGLSDISPLVGLTNLKILSLSQSGVSDISPLAGLTNLEKLYLYGNSIVDTTAACCTISQINVNGQLTVSGLDCTGFNASVC